MAIQNLNTRCPISNISTWIGLETLEPRTLCAATLISPISDVVVDENASPTEIELASHFDDTAIDGTVAQFNTVLGNWFAEMLDGAAPINVANFLNYVDDNDYADTFVHRLAFSGPDVFAVQGGSFTWDGLSTGVVPTDPPVINEPDPLNRPNIRGTIAMAKGSDPDSATGGWFVNTSNNVFLDDSNNSGGFTVIGFVLFNGMDVVDQIASLESVNAGGVLATMPVIDFQGGMVTGDHLVIVNDISRMSELIVEVVANDNPSLVDASIESSVADKKYTLTLDYAADQHGVANITIRATDLEGNTVEDTFELTVNDDFVAAPEIAMFQGVNEVVTGQLDPLNLGEVTLGVANPSLIFTVRNQGDADLIMADPVVPTGFSIVESLASLIGPGDEDTFTLQLDSGAFGVQVGTVSIANNDGDEDLFEFDIQAAGATAIDFGGNIKAMYTDANNNTVIVSLSGGGDGRVVLPSSGQGDALEIVLDNTTLKSSLKIKPIGGDRHTTVQDINVTASLGNLLAKTTDLAGNISIAGSAKLLQFANVAHQHMITIGGQTTDKDSVTLKFNRIVDLIIDSGTPIKCLTATDWLEVDGINPGDQDTIRAPWVGKIVIKGNKKLGIAGDFQAGLDLDPTGLTVLPKKTLKKVKIMGAITSRDWSIVGDVGKIVVHEVADWSLAVMGRVKVLKFGTVSNSDITVEDAIGTVTATSWDQGSLSTRTLDSIKTKGDETTGDAGNLTIDITLTGNPEARLVLAKAKAMGTLSGKWIVRGGGGTVSADLFAPSFKVSFSGIVKKIVSKNREGDNGGLLAAIAFKTLKFKGSVDVLEVLAGTDLGVDGALGGVDDQSDTFTSGSIRNFKVGGDIHQLVIRVAVDPVNGQFDDGNDVRLPEGRLHAFSAGGSMTESLILAAIVPDRIKVNGLLVESDIYDLLEHQCLQGHVGLAQHFHPFLQIRINGQQVTIPANIGIDTEPLCLHAVHTHDSNGHLHVETKTVTDVPLSTFFSVWDHPFSSTQIMEFVVDAIHELLFTVNGVPNTEFENLILVDEQIIEIEYRQIQ